VRRLPFIVLAAAIAFSAIAAPPASVLAVAAMRFGFGGHLEKPAGKP